ETRSRPSYLWNRINGLDLVLQELLQVAELDFISRAPDNTEVEHLTHKQIMKSLRDKVSAELFMEQNKWARPSSSKTKAKPSAKKTRRGTKSKSPKEEKAEPKQDESVKEVPAEATVASPMFIEQLDQLQGTKNARLLTDDEVADEVSISGLQEVLETRKNNGVNTLIMDGIITQRLIDLVPKA
ncbi:MAG: hypothetical protein VYA07_04490, partial [Candidatus Thermoplasmatota archaeon]|nr:hypothetical protein [Candidatus Thermoplasmatota archaeon]